MSEATKQVEIRQFPCLDDNFGVLVHVPATGGTIAFDVPDAERDTTMTSTVAAGEPSPGRMTERGEVAFQDEYEFGEMCRDRAANGYNSGMGEIFRKVASISPVLVSAPSPPFEAAAPDKRRPLIAPITTAVAARVPPCSLMGTDPFAGTEFPPLAFAASSSSFSSAAFASVVSSLRAEAFTLLVTLLMAS